MTDLDRPFGSGGAGRSGPYAAAEVAWGVQEEMSAVEATLWRSGSDPRLRGSALYLDVLDEVPDLVRLRAAHAWAAKRIPRLGQRVVDDPLRLGPPAWATVPFEVDHHFRHTSLPRGGTMRDVLDIAGALHAAPLHPERPLWQGMLVDGLPDGRAAYLLKLHPALADGEAFVQLFGLVHSDRRAPTPLKPSSARPPLPVVSGLGLARRHAGRLVGRAPAGTARLAARAAGAAVRSVRDPLGTTLDGVRWTASLRRVTSTPTAPSPLLARRGLARTLVALDVPVADLREAATAGGGTLDDAFLTALAAGLRHHHATHGVHVDDVAVAVPVSLRRPGEVGGHRATTARIALPVGEHDALDAMQIIRWRILSAREEPALDVLGLAAPVVSRLPSPVLTRMAIRATESVDVHAQSVEGLQREAYIAGARVLRIYPFAPVPGCALVASLVTHGDTCCIGVALDADAVPDATGFERSLRVGLADVLALRERRAAVA